MDTFDAIKSRRSIKSFQNYTMSKEEINQLLEAAILSPTSYNIQNWRFIIVTKQDLKDKLCALSYGQRQVAEASLIIILCADLKAWNKDPERYWKNIPEGPRQSIAKAIRQSYTGNPTLEKDEAMRSCGFAAQTIMLAAKAMGYDTCPMEGFDFGKVGNLINLPSDHIISMMVVVGKKAKDATPRGGQLPLSEVVFEDHF
ncbi:MAG: nitroreductase family protein [Nitrosarchaeum sp.]|nr:nitroreductase family protein [Nitrosarchaeum sp.]